MAKRTRRTRSLTVSLSAGEVCQQPDLCPAFTFHASLSRASKAQSQLLPYLHVVIELRMRVSIYGRRTNICLIDPVPSFPWYYLPGQTRHLRPSKNTYMMYYSELPHLSCAVCSNMALTSKFDLAISQQCDTIDGFCSGSEDRLTSTLGQLLDFAFAQMRQAGIDDASPWEEFCAEKTITCIRSRE
jgi:hypothetical protein